MSYYKCSLFDQKINNYSNFSFLQKELCLNSESDTSKFKIVDVEYKCSFDNFDDLDNKKPAILIPIKDNIDLIDYTLSNLFTNKINEIANIIVIDDRSKTDIRKVCKKYSVFYLRVDNNKGFNFSSLNNIAAKIVYDKNIEHIILWNSDLWTQSQKVILDLLDLHIKNNSTISGTKLIYPNFKWDNKDERHDIVKMFGLKKSHRGTVQFGGSMNINGDFFHAYRFAEPDYTYVNVDKNDLFVTGAFQIINLNWFIESGGLNPSLAKNFQDLDLCLKAIKDEKLVFYFGKDKYLLHDESVTLNKEGKFDLQLTSDRILYSKIWTRENLLKDIFKIGKFNE